MAERRGESAWGKAVDWLYRTCWATLLRKSVTVLAVVAAVVLSLVYIPDWVNEPDHCAAGVDKSDGECIGVNGSGYDFGTREIAKVAAAIDKENRRISKKPHVTVAMMLPLEPKSAADRAQLRSEVQGAYLAQYQANREENSPLMRLVLANPGADYGQQRKVVDRLKEMVDSPEDNLRAVTGFNLSLASTKEAVGRLTNELGIPVLISRASADELANPETGKPRYKTLARIIPTNQSQADALAASRVGLNDRDTVLVKDTRPNDIYNASLAKAFSRKEPGPPGPKDQPFDSPGINEIGNTGTDFNTIGQNICLSDAKVIYFAGRPVHLRLFALKLADQDCHGRKFTIVSGSGAATLDRYMSDADWKRLGGDGKEPEVTVEYAAPAHPDAWRTALNEWRKKHAGEEPPPYFTQPLDELAKLEALIKRQRAGDIGDVELDDSRTMLVHDGMLTISHAVWLANSQAKKGTVPTLERVAAQWPRLESTNRVWGTSGWICLTNSGNPYDKPVAVVTLNPRTKKVDFSKIGWPNKKPQPQNCVVPSGTR
ncbi:ABC transporter substrate-binding protein [Actinomycetota bacterium Odt1-20B]